MFDVSGNGIITISKGDDISAELILNGEADGTYCHYELQDGDIIKFFVLEPNVDAVESLASIYKEYTADDLNENGNIILKLIPEDTSSLQSGSYIYTIKLERQLSQDEVEISTVVPRTKCFIVE